MTLGQRISAYRKNAGISQEELGARLGVSRQAVSKWENDLTVPDMNNILGLAQEFGISVAELTETPEAGSLPEKTPIPQVSAEPSGASPDAAPKGDKTGPSGGKLLVCVLLALLVCVSLFLVLQLSRVERTPNTGMNDDLVPDGIAAEPPSDQGPAQEAPSDFTLVLDWTESGEYLELGEQDGDYPFGTSLYLSGGETVVKGNNGEEVHTVGSLEDDAFRLRYSHIEGDGLPARNVITLLEVVRTREVSTPRDIRVGSTKADVVAAYGPDSLVYCLKDEGGEPLCQHDYYYAYQPKSAYSNSLCLFMQDGLVAGIRVENMADLGNEAYAVNDLTRFPVQANGDPDHSNRQDLYQEPVDDTRRVYIAWERLVTDDDLSAEERYVYRSQVFTGLPDLDWQEFGKLGTTDDLATSEAFASWLREQTFSDSELFWVQVGLNATGLDGAYSENYCSLLAAALFQDPVGYAKQLPRTAGYSEQVRAHILGSTVYGADYHTADCAAAVEALDAVIGTNALTEDENDWAKLLRCYLENTNNGYYADFPKTPEEAAL